LKTGNIARLLVQLQGVPKLLDPSDRGNALYEESHFTFQDRARECDATILDADLDRTRM
jgi:hypothetical protein